MKQITKSILTGLSLAVLTAGCQCPFGIYNPKVSYNARYIDKPVKINGKTQHQWTVPAQKLFAAPTTEITEKTYIKFRWDKQYLYCFAHLVDSDIVTEAKNDDPKSVTAGDYFELFIRPGKSTVMWSFTFGPEEHKAIHFIPGPGHYKLPSTATAEECKIPVKFKVLNKGTVNNYKDKDKFWNVEIAIPLKDMEKYGGTIKPGTVWNVLAYRRNYSVYLSDAETSISQNHDDKVQYIMKDKSWAKLKFTK